MEHKKSFTGKKSVLKTSGATSMKSGGSKKSIHSKGLPIDEKQFIGDAGKTIEPAANGPRDQKGY